MEFDLQTIWTGAGLSAAAVIVGYVLGFLQSVAPWLPSSGVFRNWTIAIVSAFLVVLAGITSGRTLEDPNVVGNLFGGFLVFLGLYNAAKNAHGAGEATAVRTAGGAEISSPATPFG